MPSPEMIAALVNSGIGGIMLFLFIRLSNANEKYQQASLDALKAAQDAHIASLREIVKQSAEAMMGLQKSVDSLQKQLGDHILKEDDLLREIREHQIVGLGWIATE